MTFEYGLIITTKEGNILHSSIDGASNGDNMLIALNTIGGEGWEISWVLEQSDQTSPNGITVILKKQAE